MSLNTEIMVLIAPTTINKLGINARRKIHLPIPWTSLLLVCQPGGYIAKWMKLALP